MRLLNDVSGVPLRCCLALCGADGKANEVGCRRWRISDKYYCRNAFNSTRCSVLVFVID